MLVELGLTGARLPDKLKAKLSFWHGVQLAKAGTEKSLSSSHSASMKINSW
jgi:hypothetical protein